MARYTTEQRQEQIVNEAIQIIHEKGYKGLSIRELAKKVGISEPAIYRHFTNKDEIILGILERMAQSGLDIQRHLKEVADPKEKIRQLVLRQLQFLERNPQMTAVIFSEDIFEPNEIIQQKLKNIMAGRFKMLSEIIEEAKSQGNVVDVETEDLVTVILGYIRMVVFEWRNAKFSYSLQERGQRVLATLEKVIFKN